MNHNRENIIWKYFRGEWQAFSADMTVIRKLLSWNKVSINGIYTFQNRTVGKSILFPTLLYDRVAKELNLSQRKKSHGRVKWGERIGESAKNRQRKNGKFTPKND